MWRHDEPFYMGLPSHHNNIKLKWCTIHNIVWCQLYGSNTSTYENVYQNQALEVQQGVEGGGYQRMGYGGYKRITGYHGYAWYQNWGGHKWGGYTRKYCFMR